MFTFSPKFVNFITAAKARTMASVGALPMGLDVRKAYTLAFVNKRAGR
jgi:hypothetical protein